jgi:quinoprotein glucose dehydrogenase
MKPILTLLFVVSTALAAEPLPTVHVDDFEKGGAAWLPTDAKKWSVDKQDDGNHVLHLHGKSAYEPPHRSPHSLTLLKDTVVGSFELTARVRTLQTTRGHRDMCVFFGFQDPAHFYYVHLGEVPDPHSSQIFIVNDAPRTKITETPDVGVPWTDDQWHRVKVVRDVASGLIEVYFDDMTKPQKVAHDRTFAWGAIGLGSFDDLGLWDDFELRGVMVKKKVDAKFKSAPAKPKPVKKKVVAEPVKSAVSAADLAEQAKTLKFTKWSGAVNIPDPVAVSLDNHGTAYVTQTQRRKANDLDIRSNRDWIPDDVGFQSVEDKRAHFRKHLAPGNSEKNKERVDDLNKDGSHDWKDLTVLTERIYQVKDTDGDGIADQRVTYAEDFNTEITGIAAGVLWHQGDVYATVAPDVWRLRDTDGDGKADTRDLMAHGFGLHIAYGGHDMHGLRVGPDGRIYWSIGDKGISVISKEGRRFHYPNQGGVLRAEADGSNFEVFAHGLRNVQEMDFDEAGNWFGVDNDSDQPGEKERFVHIVEDMDAGWRNNYQYRGEGFNPWMDEGISIPWHTGQPAYILPPIRNYEDGPCGFAYNPGTALNPQYRNYFFMTEAPRGTQWAFQVRPKGASFEMINSHQIGNGIPLTGWNFGPDGALYAADWGGGYPLNETGAIWKMDDPNYAGDAARVEVAKILGAGFDKLPKERLAKLLGHIDKRVRLGAQFELVQRDEPAVLGGALKSGNALAKTHALWGFGQLARTKDSSVAKNALSSALRSSDPDVQIQAIKMLGDLKPGQFQSAQLTSSLTSKVPRVFFHAAIAAGKHGLRAAVKPLVAAANRLRPEETYLRHAITKGLAGAASADELAKLSAHKKEAVRVCAVVALRRQASPAVAVFLSDKSQVVIDEAARAIHDDWSISDAMPALAEKLGGSSEPFVRRAISANLRLGSPAHVGRVTAYALRSDAPLPMRLEALDALKDWSEPPLLDRVDGRRRDLGLRDSKEIAKAIGPRLGQLLKSGENSLIERAIALSTQYELEIAPDALNALLRFVDAPPSLRVVALRGLGTIEAIDFALGSDADELRSEAARLLAGRDVERALKHLDRVLKKSPSLRERQAALSTVAGLKHDDVKRIVIEATDLLKNDKAPRGLQLDIIEAAEKLGLEERLEAFNQRRDPEKYTDGFIECLEGGDPKAGLRVINTHIYAQCVRCHKLDDSKGGSIIGPNLKNVGSKGRDYILHSMLDPNAVVTKGYGIMNVVLDNDEVVGGQFRGETKTHVELRMPDGKSQKIEKSRIKDRTAVMSVMPTMGNILTKRELRDVIEYLAGLKEPEKARR